MRAMPIALTIALLVTAHRASADGFPVEKGRYSGGPVVTLVLTEGQRNALATEHWLTLTNDQKARVAKKAGAGPSELLVYDVRRNESDCTCSAWNVAFRFSEEGLDVPLEYVVSDEEAERRQAELEAM